MKIESPKYGEEAWICSIDTYLGTMVNNTAPRGPGVAEATRKQRGALDPIRRMCSRLHRMSTVARINILLPSATPRAHFCTRAL